MKKISLVLSILFVSLSLSAADLNPFAYGLKLGTPEGANAFTRLCFSLNAKALSVKVVIVDEDKNEYVLRSYNEEPPKGDYGTDVSATELLELGVPVGQDLSWRVDVTGDKISTPTFVSNNNKLFCPTSIDIDNNPENPNFGTIFCVEARDGGKGNSNFLSEEDGKGLYVFNADATPRKIPNQIEDRYGYNGAITDLLTMTPFNDSGLSSENAGNSYFLYRVRVSDDGRVFITSLSPDGHVLFEANKEVFSHPDAPDWSSKTQWTKVISKANDNTNQKTTKNNCSDGNHKYCNIYNLYTDNGEFIAGPNCGFDVRGSGENLKLLMLSGCKQAIGAITPEHFYCYEYNLRTNTLWNTKPNHIFTGSMSNLKILNYGGVQVQYDKQGNIWLCQHRGDNDGAPTLLKISPSGTVTNMDGKTVTYRRCGAIRFNEDFSRVVVASNATNSQGGGFTYYDVDAAGNWTEKSTVNTYAKTGNSLMDFAWDYAGNLYMVGDLSTNGQRIAVYAMPNVDNRVVSTPAASRYAFTVNCQEGEEYQVTTKCNLPGAGTITCSVGGNARDAGNITVASCTELTVTATPEDSYKFLNWTDDNGNVLSTNKEYSLYVTEAITLQANFEYATYTGVVWKSLFLNGEDIADENSNYPNTNERLWRLLQVEYNDKYTDRNDYPDLVSSNVVQACKGKKTQLNVMGFFGRDEANKANAQTFFNNNGLFAWLKNYMIAHSKNGLGTTTRTSPWYGYAYLFFNRTDTAILWYEDRIGDRGTFLFNGANCAQTSYGNENNPWDSFIEYGQPKYWRPYWAEHACNLPQTMKYSDYMPTIDTWARPSCPSGSIAGVTPSSWYKWNLPPDDEEFKKYHMLAWRANSPTGDTIVHHVYRDNMELHASYVLKNIDENDAPADPANLDASNEDVIKLMQNPNFDPEDGSYIASHAFTVTRKLQKGMYNTICMPLSIDINGLMDAHHLKNATVLQFSGVTTKSYNDAGETVTVLNFTEIPSVDGKKIIEKGVPYLIMVDEGVTEEKLLEDMPFTGVARDNLTLEAQNSETLNGITFHGTINPTDIPANSLILVADNRLALTTEKSKMAGMRGYFTIDPMIASDIAEQAAAGRVDLSFNKPVTTSVPLAPEAEQPKKIKAQKIMRNGQIYILRGDEVYTITGHRVK